MSEHGEDKDHGLCPQSEPSEKYLERIPVASVIQVQEKMPPSFVGGCLSWIHKKCSGIKGSLRRDPDYSCAGCLDKARPIDGRLVKEVLDDEEKFEAVPEFCYLGDMLSAGGGFERAAVTHCKSASGKFRQLLPLHTNRNLPRLTRGRVYSTYVLPHAAETWTMTGYTLSSPAVQ